MTALSPFTPAKGGILTAGSASATVSLQDSGTNCKQVELTNTSATATDVLVVAFGDSTITTAALSGTLTTGRYAVGAGQCKVVTKPEAATHMAYIRNGSADIIFLVNTGNGQ